MKSLTNFLKETENIDFQSENIQEKAKQIFNSQMNEIEKVEVAYLFVRDSISHSWDIAGTTVTKKASEALTFREGICWPKTHLLAALLRTQNIPCGFCYQRLTLFSDPDDGYCVHALNAVYISSLEKWIRLDPRGNKPGIEAQFSIDKEQLAFEVDQAKDEQNYPEIYSEPHPELLKVLEQHHDPLYMYRYALPEKL